MPFERLSDAWAAHRPRGRAISLVTKGELQMSLHMVGRRGLVVLVAGMTAALGGGCANNGPSGAGGGITSSSNRTPGMYKAPEAETTQLLQFADQVSEALSARINSIPDITDTSKPKVVIALGNIDNTTRTPSRDFAAIRRRVFTRLVNSNLRQHADIIENLEIMDAQNERFAQPSGPDRLDEGNSGGPARVARWNRDRTYIINGTFSELLRGDVSTYLFDMTLTQLSTGRIEFAEQYDFKQERR